MKIDHWRKDSESTSFEIIDSGSNFGKFNIIDQRTGLTVFSATMTWVEIQDLRDLITETLDDEEL